MGKTMTVCLLSTVSNDPAKFRRAKRPAKESGGQKCPRAKKDVFHSAGGHQHAKGRFPLCR
jgi:hypothetical protein